MIMLSHCEIDELVYILSMLLCYLKYYIHSSCYFISYNITFIHHVISLLHKYFINLLTCFITSKYLIDIEVIISIIYKIFKWFIKLNLLFSCMKVNLLNWLIMYSRISLVFKKIFRNKQLFFSYCFFNQIFSELPCKLLCKLTIIIL